MARTIKDNIKDFRKALTVKTPKEVLDHFVVGSSAWMLSGDAQVTLRREFADFAEVNVSQVIIVGSTKLSFKLKPDERYKHFGAESDIDLAVISTELFDRIHWEVAQHFESVGTWGRISDYAEYQLRGWVRPDMWPAESKFSFSKLWWEKCNELSVRSEWGPRKVRAAVYKEFRYFDHYHLRTIVDCARLEQLKKA